MTAQDVTPARISGGGGITFATDAFASPPSDTRKSIGAGGGITFAAAPTTTDNHHHHQQQQHTAVSTPQKMTTRASFKHAQSIATATTAHWSHVASSPSPSIHEGESSTRAAVGSPTPGALDTSTPGHITAGGSPIATNTVHLTAPHRTEISLPSMAAAHTPVTHQRRLIPEIAVSQSLCGRSESLLPPGVSMVPTPIAAKQILMHPNVSNMSPRRQSPLAPPNPKGATYADTGELFVADSAAEDAARARRRMESTDQNPGGCMSPAAVIERGIMAWNSPPNTPIYLPQTPSMRMGSPGSRSPQPGHGLPAAVELGFLRTVHSPPLRGIDSPGGHQMVVTSGHHLHTTEGWTLSTQGIEPFLVDSSNVIPSTAFPEDLMSPWLSKNRMAVIVPITADPVVFCPYRALKLTLSDLEVANPKSLVLELVHGVEQAEVNLDNAASLTGEADEAGSKKTQEFCKLQVPLEPRSILRCSVRTAKEVLGHADLDVSQMIVSKTHAVAGRVTILTPAGEVRFRLVAELKTSAGKKSLKTASGVTASAGGPPPTGEQRAAPMAQNTPDTEGHRLDESTQTDAKIAEPKKDVSQKKHAAAEEREGTIAKQTEGTKLSTDHGALPVLKEDLDDVAVECTPTTSPTIIPMKRTAETLPPPPLPDAELNVKVHDAVEEEKSPLPVVEGETVVPEAPSLPNEGPITILFSPGQLINARTGVLKRVSSVLVIDGDEAFAHIVDVSQTISLRRESSSSMLTLELFDIEGSRIGVCHVALPKDGESLNSFSQVMSPDGSVTNSVFYYSIEVQSSNTAAAAAVAAPASESASVAAEHADSLSQNDETEETEEDHILPPSSLNPVVEEPTEEESQESDPEQVAVIKQDVSTSKTPPPTPAGQFSADSLVEQVTIDPTADPEECEVESDDTAPEIHSWKDVDFNPEEGSDDSSMVGVPATNKTFRTAQTMCVSSLRRSQPQEPLRRRGSFDATTKVSPMSEYAKRWPDRTRTIESLKSLQKEITDAPRQRQLKHLREEVQKQPILKRLKQVQQELKKLPSLGDQVLLLRSKGGASRNKGESTGVPAVRRADRAGAEVMTSTQTSKTQTVRRVVKRKTATTVSSSTTVAAPTIIGGAAEKTAAASSTRSGAEEAPSQPQAASSPRAVAEDAPVQPKKQVAGSTVLPGPTAGEPSLEREAPSKPEIEVPAPLAPMTICQPETAVIPNASSMQAIPPSMPSAALPEMAEVPAAAPHAYTDMQAMVPPMAPPHMMEHHHQGMPPMMVSPYMGQYPHQPLMVSMYGHHQHPSMQRASHPLPATVHYNGPYRGGVPPHLVQHPSTYVRNPADSWYTFQPSMPH